MASIVVISGPVGAGKTTVSRALLASVSAPAAYIEGDAFWSFVAKPAQGEPRQTSFRMIMRAMMASAAHFVRDGYEVILDFSIPPRFLEAARPIFRGAAVDLVIVKPSLAVCAARARDRAEGAIANYDDGFYALFEGAERHMIADDDADAASLAAPIREGLAAGAYRV